MSVATFLRFFIMVAVSVVLVGCSNVNRLYLETLRLAFFEDGPSLSFEQVSESKVDFLKVLHGERLPVYMALAYIEDGQDKWVSADHVVVAMDRDKIIRIAGLDVDLQYTDNIESNPLRAADKLSQANWQYHIDVEEHHFGLPVESQWQRGAPQQVTFYDKAFTIIPVTETVSVDIYKPYWVHETSWQNVYWLEQESGQIIYSEQQPTPNSDRMKMTFVSRIARLIKARETN